MGQLDPHDPNNGGVLGAGNYRRGAARAISAVVVAADHRHGGEQRRASACRTLRARGHRRRRIQTAAGTAATKYGLDHIDLTTSPAPPQSLTALRRPPPR